MNSDIVEHQSNFKKLYEVNDDSKAKFKIYQ
jgi:hypothetical protein